MLTPERKNLNATNFWATNPFEMRLQNLKQERKCDIFMESKGIQESRKTAQLL